MLKNGTRNPSMLVHVLRLQPPIKVEVSNKILVILPQISHKNLTHRSIITVGYLISIDYHWRMFDLGKGHIQADEDSSLYKEIVLRQHAVPLSDLLQTNES